jgi:GNAT superfamily N-acetyltransferase
MEATIEKPKIQVTYYKPEYNGDIMQLCQLFVEESLSEYGINVTTERLQEMINICKGVSFFLEDAGRPVGVIAGMVVNSLTDGKASLQEVIWYVHPHYRKHGHKLLQAFEKEARKLRMTNIVMASMCNSMHERVDRIYKKLGYRPFEVQYIKELEYAGT